VRFVYIHFLGVHSTAPKIFGGLCFTVGRGRVKMTNNEVPISMFQSAKLLADLLNDKDSHCSKNGTGLNLLCTYRVSAILYCSHMMSAWMKISLDKSMCKH
jgi:hypothetical protein